MEEKMKQSDLFSADFVDPADNEKYTKKIQIPIYEPKNIKPNVIELVDKSKANRLIYEINSAGLGIDETYFLLEAAKRHNVFNYSKIADYYSHASKNMQKLMEKSALVIIDFDKAIQYGYAKLSNGLTQTLLSEPSHEQ